MAPVNHTRPAIMAALGNGDMSLAELVEELGSLASTIQYNLRRLLDADEIHICGWGLPKRQGLRHPIYRLGTGKNRQRGRQTTKERRAIQLAWHRRKTVWRSMESQVDNPFGSLIAQMGGKFERTTAESRPGTRSKS